MKNKSWNITGDCHQSIVKNIVFLLRDKLCEDVYGTVQQLIFSQSIKAIDSAHSCNVNTTEKRKIISNWSTSKFKTLNLFQKLQRFTFMSSKYVTFYYVFFLRYKSINQVFINCISKNAIKNNYLAVNSAHENA